jgi:DNA repair exonuclease SbcCD nuclease subunit
MIKYLGDVHLGKKFLSGTPLHRRGDREKLQWAEFERHLNDVDKLDIHIQVGDLFDAAVVPYSVVYRAAMAYREAVARNPFVTYALIQGNHDDSRDVEKVTAFDLFCAIVEQIEGVVIAREHTQVIDNIALIPWHPVLTAKEVLVRDEDLIHNADIAVGHWDVVMGDSNQLPAHELRALGVAQAITGHDHHRRDIEIDDLPVHVTGSMQPYSHAEDPDEQFYVTRSLAAVLADPEGFKDKHLRVVLEPGEVLDVPVDCLSLSFTREAVEGEDQATIDVEFEVFDIEALFNDVAGVLTPEMKAAVWGKILDARVADDEG